jgi:hypothetical protein
MNEDLKRRADSDPADPTRALKGKPYNSPRLRPLGSVRAITLGSTGESTKKKPQG